MDIFVEMEVILPDGKIARRLFNVRYIKSLDLGSKTVLLHGNMKAFSVKPESLSFLLSVLRKKGVMHERK